jgi:hypothetical protein
LGEDIDSVNTSISNFKDIEFGRMVDKPKLDKIAYVFDREEKEELENEEVDKLILHSLCSEILEEVMDLGSASLMGCDTTPTRIGKTQGTKENKKKKNLK